jgi:hypothetical protein
MMGYLFRGSAHSYRETAVRQAVEEVKSLAPNYLADPGLAGTINKIVGKYGVFAVATLRPNEKRGKRRTETRQIRDYGETRNVEVSLMDVFVPFSGAEESFELAPSSSHVIQTPVQVTQGQLVFTFHDDSAIERDLEAAIKQISENLDRLRAELGNLESSVRQAVEAVAADRLARIKSQAERDSRLGFPVD